MNKESIRQEIIKAAQGILSGEMQWVEGVRILSSLRHNLDDADNSLDWAIGFDSETDTYPLGDYRNRCAPEYLERKDKETADYFTQIKDVHFDLCRETVEHFGKLD
jgi:hypothetical protein